MTDAFDTLGYADYLKEGGVPADQAQTHARAARDFIMVQLVTKKDLENLELRLTLRLGTMVGAMLTVAVGVLTAIIKLT